MRLIRLRMQNFRQHADTEIHFRPGLTGIIGPNGAGKSTILEAIAWAIYGAEAARGTNETLRFVRAGARSRVEVELDFELGGHEYRVSRTLHQAEVFLDGGAAPVATTLGGVTRYLQGRLGMSRREFFNTYFTGQKELQFLATMGSAERGRFLSQVLGYERLRQAQELARSRRSALRHELAGLRAAMADPDELRARREGAERTVASAQQALADAQATRAGAAAALAEMAPRWAAAQLARERFRELSHAAEQAERERAAAERDLARAESELAQVASAEADLTGLRSQLARLPDVAGECDRLSELARRDERRKALVARRTELGADLDRLAERIAKMERAPELAERFAAELERLRAEQRAAEAEREERKTAWTRDKQDAHTKLESYRERGRELKEQIRGIRDAGPEGKCPTCERALGADFERVLDELEEQWAHVVQDGKWWNSRHEQLQKKPDDVAALEAKVIELATAVDEAARKHTRCVAAVDELKGARAEQAQMEERRSALEAELAEIPAGYDREAHSALEAELRALRTLETRVARLEETAARRATWEAERTDAHARTASALARAETARRERDELGITEAAFAEVRAAYEGASERVRRAELAATEAGGTLRLAEQTREAALVAEQQLAQQQREAAARDEELVVHHELDAALSELRGELNAQLRPELSEIASAFLAQLTDGRYTALEIDDAYNILILDEGEEKPVISGGEEDVANLVIRLSLSQMIAERAGHPFSLLILDEVFGSLDVARRDNVVQLLRHLEDRFEQVILITHIEGIREALDQVLRVSFDERTGASVVREELLPGTVDAMVEMAAD